ncbi:MAG TPA: hemerythrin domain-containing protein [Gammaproteobacteria bacterium]|nr:hemerythrin domain-containing protein [Gammaproteobacteria bacterium]
MRVNPIIEKLRLEHADMRRVIILIRLQLDLLERHAQPDLVLLANALYYMRKFPSVVHHPKEELIFEKLVARGAPVQKEVEQLHVQHQEIYALEDNLIELALALQKGDSQARTRLLEFGRHYIAIQAMHAETEERILFPAAQQNLRANDWKDVRKKSVRIEDPLFGSNPTERYRNLYDYLLREAADSGVSLPAAHQVSASSSNKTSSSR